MSNPRGEGAWWRSAGQRRTWVTAAPSNGGTSRPPARPFTGAPGADDPAVDVLITGLLGESPSGAQGTATQTATATTTVAPPRPRQPIQWPPRPAGTTPEPQRLKRFERVFGGTFHGNRDNTDRGLRTGTRIVLALALVAGIVTAAIVTTRSMLAASSTNFDGVLAVATPVPLNFQSTGQLATVDVVNGQSVGVGQVLATQNDTVDLAEVRADRLTLAQDEKLLGGLLGPAGQVAATQAATDYTKAFDLANAQESRGAEDVARAQAILAEAQQSVVNEQNLLSANNATYNQKCKKLGFAGCSSLEREIQLDQNGLNQAQARVTSADATLAASQSIDTTLQQLASNEATLAAQAQTNVTPAELTGITNAANAVAQDNAHLTAALQNLFNDTLVSPVAGRVEAVNAVPGDTVGPSDGSVTTGASSSGIAGSSPSGPSTVKGDLGSMPFITIEAAPGLEVIAQIPEQNITSIKVGETATVTVDSGSSQAYQAKVAAIELVPVVVQGTVFYDVVAEPVGAPWPTDLLAGMTANVTIP